MSRGALEFLTVQSELILNSGFARTRCGGGASATRQRRTVAQLNYARPASVERISKIECIRRQRATDFKQFFTLRCICCAAQSFFLIRSSVCVCASVNCGSSVLWRTSNSNKYCSGMAE